MKLLFAFIAAVFVATTVLANPTTGKSAIEGRITNGALAKPKQFPYQCGLLIVSTNGPKWCGGTLISDRWIVTAAQCVDRYVRPSQVNVYLGTTNRLNASENGQQIIAIKGSNVFVHDEWMSANKDIALLKLPAPVEFNDYVRPAILPKFSNIYSTYEGYRAIASGWGKMSDDTYKGVDHLRWINVPIMKNEECTNQFHWAIKPNEICIKTKEERKSPCHQDIGGPLVLDDGSNTLVGVHSVVSYYGCTAGYPAVYTRITDYLDWIEKISGVAHH